MDPNAPFASLDPAAAGLATLGSQTTVPPDTHAWSAGLLWANVLPDLSIAAACLVIPLVLLRLGSRRTDLRFNSLLVWTCVFILACGAVHAVEIWNLWHTHYWLEGGVKIAAAVAAVPVAVLLWRALPQLLSLPSQQQLRDTNDSLARANRELESFTASVSHDLRSPLTTIAGQAGLLELSLPPGSEEQRKRLQRIQAGVKQMSELIEALLVLSRISRHTLRREIIDISALAQEIAGDLQQQAPARQVEFSVSSGLRVHGDRRLIGNLLSNLLGNAWKFTGKLPAARIELSLVSAGPMAEFQVRDNGAGFDMTQTHRLFKPFQRLHGPDEFAGTGVGLATVARIVERHGGRIWAEAAPNAGAAFHFTLPTAPLR